MLSLGENHDQGDRIHDSLVSHDQNLAVMTLLLKDHKEGDKTRQVVSGNSSNTVGLSITVSMFLEAVASSIEHPIEVNSSEDLLARFEEVNKVWREKMSTEEDIEKNVTDILTDPLVELDEHPDSQREYKPEMSEQQTGPLIELAESKEEYN